MLTPDTRALLLQSLQPPVGFEFDTAVATTFTLDLTATLIPALSLTQMTSEGLVRDPIAMMQALRSTANRVDIFCQGGNVSVPTTAPQLMAFVEPMIHEVKRPPHGLFHPKVWAVRYRSDDGDLAYRVLVLTRNLTNDNSWDIVVRLDSERLADGPIEENRELVRFLKSLAPRTIRPVTQQRKKRINALADELSRVVWEPLPNLDAAPRFHFFDGSENRAAMFTTGHAGMNWSRHLVVSPYVRPGGALDNTGQEISVVSRAEELEKLPPAVLQGFSKTYVLDDVALLDSAALDGTPSTFGLLHAKLYISEPTNYWAKARVLIGSANATEPAFSKNVELMVELFGQRKALGIETFVESCGRLLADYEATGGAEPDPKEDLQRQLDDIVRSVAEARFQVTVYPAESGQGYDLHLTTEQAINLKGCDRGHLHVLGREASVFEIRDGSPLDAWQRSINLADITAFLVLTVADGGLTSSTVVIADLMNEPRERLDAIVAEQLDTPEKFLRFMLLLMSFGDPAAMAGFGQLTRGAGGLFGGETDVEATLLEPTLQALATNPSVLDEMDRVVTRLRADTERSVLPEGFDGFWDQVTQARAMLESE